MMRWEADSREFVEACDPTNLAFTIEKTGDPVSNKEVGET